MSQTLASVQTLIAAGDVQVTSHGDDELAKDQISLRELLDTVQSAVVVEDYPPYAKGPCVLVLQHDASVGRFTWCGGSERAKLGQPCSSRLTDLIRASGQMTFSRGSHERP